MRNQINIMGNTHEITFFDDWNDAENLDNRLHWFGDPFTSGCENIVFKFPPNCRIKLDAAARLLSLINQLVFEDFSVTLAFEGNNHLAMTYLNRANFFSLLSDGVKITPTQPNLRIPNALKGNTDKLVEFNSIDPRIQDIGILPEVLGASVMTLLKRKKSYNYSQTNFSTIFSELITNICEHSDSVLYGSAAFQVYSNGPKPNAVLVISDSGRGIIDTLRPTLRNPKHSMMPDDELICAIFREQLSRKPLGGNGLNACALKAAKFKATITIRLANSSVTLVPSEDAQYVVDSTKSFSNLPLIKGTHIRIKFLLDKQ